MTHTRRAVLAAGASWLALPLLPAFGPRHRPAPVRFRSDPFRLGVASGDPDHQSLVLWTRLCAEVLQPDGGLPNAPVEVAWELADDERFTAVRARGTTLAVPELGHAVHVEVAGLPADRWFHYRFRAGDAESPIGRTRTLPAPTVLPERLRFAFASCQHYETGLYTAYGHMAEQDLDLVCHLGDSIYEGKGRDGLVRKHHGGKLQTLHDYRVRHAQYRSDPLLAAMHARCPWFVTWDDHEVENNYADDHSERPNVTPEQFLQQRAAAYQAYYEAMPLRRAALPKGPHSQLYRHAAYGRLVDLFVLDTRQYRTVQPNGDGRKPLNAAARDPGNTLLGAAQREWLAAGLRRSPARWQVLAQQVMMGLVGHRPKATPAPAKADAKTDAKTGQSDAGPAHVDELRFAMDQWPGYFHERAWLLRQLAAQKTANPIVLTGDIHSHWVNDLRLDDHAPQLPVVASEFVGSSISSGGDGEPAAAELAALQRDNPCVQFLNRQRGYVACTVTPELWTADYFTVDQVTRPGGVTSLAARFHVAAGQRGVHRD